MEPKTRLLKLSDRLHRLHRFDAPCFMISALLRNGTKHLRNFLLLAAQPGEWTAPPDRVHLQSPLQLATEIIRGQIFQYFERELPYAIMQRNLGWTELRNGDLRIDQEVRKHRVEGTHAQHGHGHVCAWAWAWACTCTCTCTC